jgi:hypothetical protein
MFEPELWMTCAEAHRVGTTEAVECWCPCHGQSIAGLVRVPDGAVERLARYLHGLQVFQFMVPAWDDGPEEDRLLWVETAEAMLRVAIGGGTV